MIFLSNDEYFLLSRICDKNKAYCKAIILVAVSKKGYVSVPLGINDDMFITKDWINIQPNDASLTFKGLWMIFITHKFMIGTLKSINDL